MTIAPHRPPTRFESPPAAEALIREARQRQRRRRLIVGVIVLALVATAVVVFDGPGSGGPARPTSGSGHPVPLVIPPASQLHAEMLANYLPTSAADFTAGEQFLSLVNALTVEREARCLTNAGFPSSIRVITPGDGMADNTEFPPTSRIASSGFNAGSQQVGGAALVNAGSWVAGRTSSQFTQARSRCNASAIDYYAPLYSGTPESLQTEWMFQVIPQIDNSTAFTDALVGWSTCMKGGGVHVATIDEFFNYSSQQTAAIYGHGPPQRSSAEKIENLGKLFGRCLGPAEAVRVRLRISARSTFIDTHSAELSSLTALVNRLVG